LIISFCGLSRLLVSFYILFSIIFN